MTLAINNFEELRDRIWRAYQIISQRPGFFRENSLYKKKMSNVYRCRTFYKY